MGISCFIVFQWLCFADTELFSFSFLFFFFTYWRFVATLVRWWLASFSNEDFLIKMYMFCFQPSLHSDKMRCNGSILCISCCFAESFHFCLRFKGFVNKISHSLYTTTQYRYLLENYLAYFQHTNIKRKEKIQRMHHQIGFWPTSRLKQLWEVPCHSASGVPAGKGSQAAHPFHGWDFKDWSSGFPLIIPGWSQADITNLCPNCSSGFMLMLFAFSCITWNTVKPGSWSARPPPGLNNLKISAHLI